MKLNAIVLLVIALGCCIFPTCLARTYLVKLHTEDLIAAEVDTFDLGEDYALSCDIPELNFTATMSICHPPASIHRYYGVDRLIDEGFSGQNQTIVLVGYYGPHKTLQSDFDRFSEAFGLPSKTIQVVHPDGVEDLTTIDPNLVEGWNEETALDVQWAHAVAPEAEIVSLYLNSNHSDEETLRVAVEYVMDNYPGAVFSMSFGKGEMSPADPEEVHALLETLDEAGLKGITFLTGSGDSDCASCNETFPGDCTGPLIKMADLPSSYPQVTSVGGTALYTAMVWAPYISWDEYSSVVLSKNVTKEENEEAHLLYYNFVPNNGSAFEAVWNSFFSGTGGGLSSVYDAPGYQSSLNYTGRATPDVAWVASPRTGVPVIFNNKTELFGGTSVSSPSFAGLIAIANQIRASKGKSPIGLLNDAIYGISGIAFRDVVAETFGPVTLDSNTLYADVGNTYVTPPELPIEGYNTTEGYDLTTGRGSPRGYEFAYALAAWGDSKNNSSNNHTEVTMCMNGKCDPGYKCCGNTCAAGDDTYNCCSVADFSYACPSGFNCCGYSCCPVGGVCCNNGGPLQSCCPGDEPDCCR